MLRVLVLSPYVLGREVQHRVAIPERQTMSHVERSMCTSGLLSKTGTQRWVASLTINITATIARLKVLRRTLTLLDPVHRTPICTPSHRSGPSLQAKLPATRT